MTAGEGLAIACAAGGFRGAFVHGVLSALEEGGLRAEAYGGVSSAALSATAAASGHAAEIGIGHWFALLDLRNRSAGDMSPVIKTSIDQTQPLIAQTLFEPGAPRLLLVASAVAEDAAGETQGEGARRLGRRLLVAAGRGDRRWIKGNLHPVLFDRAGIAGPALHRGNLAQVLYASTRVMHAWSEAAWIDDMPYVDGAYTLACPALELANMKYAQILAIGTQPGPIPLDILGDRTVPSWAGETPIVSIVPDIDPGDLNVEVTTAEKDGLGRLFNHGREKGAAFLA